MKTITQEYATQFFSTKTLLLNFQADLDLHVSRQKENPDNPEFVNSLHYINGELRNVLFQLNQILPNETDKNNNPLFNSSALKLHQSSCRKCNSSDIDTVVQTQREEINALKKELDNSKFGAQCSIHELEYDKNTLIKENMELNQKIELLEGQLKIKQMDLHESRNISDGLAHSIQNLGHNSDEAVKKYNSSLYKPTLGIPIHNIFTAYNKLMENTNTNAEKEIPKEVLVFGNCNEWAVREDDGCLIFHPQWNTNPHKTTTYIWSEAWSFVQRMGGFDDLVRWFRKNKLENIEGVTHFSDLSSSDKA